MNDTDTEPKAAAKPEPRLVSIDIETTGLGPHCAMTEIALYDLETEAAYHQYIQIDGRADWEAFSLEHTATGRGEHEVTLWAGSVDLRINRWLHDLGATPGQVMALGWNVGSFDRQYIKKDLHRLDGWLSYRHVDLTAIRHLFDAVSMPMDCTDHAKHAKHGEHCDNWAEHSKAMAKATLGGDDAHDALWDARAAALFYRTAEATLNGFVRHS